MEKRLAVWGWWQGNNLGDNWIKHVMSKIFPSAVFIDTTVKDFSGFDFVICGGGGIFIYGVPNPWKTCDFKASFGILGLGAEFPHKDDTAYKLSRKAKFFFVRDDYSLDCMRVNDCARSYDITFYAPLQFKEIKDINTDNLFFVWRDGRELSEKESFKEYICYEDNFDIYDKIIRNEFTKIIRNDFQADDYDAEKMMADSGFVISGRFHGIAAAIQKGLPCIAIDICPKIRIIMRDCGLEEYCVKVNETDRLAALIRKAKANVFEIRKKQMSYTNRASAQLKKDIASAISIIDPIIGKCPASE